MLKTVFLLSIALNVMFASAQDSLLVQSNAEISDSIIDPQIQYIKRLENGFLLVRLDFQRRKIDYFEKFENFKESEKVKKEAFRINQIIVSTFDSIFNFCPVLFFANEDSKKVVSQNFEEVQFYNSKFEVVSNLKLTKENYLIGEFGFIEQDAIDEAVTKSSMSAFVIRDIDFKQLRPPFPYYTRFYPLVKSTKRYDLPVRKINKKLHEFAIESNFQ